MNGVILRTLNQASDSIFSPFVRRCSFRLAQDLHVPEHLVTHLLAIEDKRFMLHLGVDPISIARALLENLRLRRMSHGASTITQQLYNIKFHNSVPQRKTLSSKAKQQTWAVLYSLSHSKVSVLAEYLSEVYWGNTFYGLKAAAYGYFHKDPDELSPSESFFLCERIAWPNICSPERVLELVGRSAIRTVLFDAGTVREMLRIYQHFFACGLQLETMFTELAPVQVLTETHGFTPRILSQFRSQRFPMREAPAYERSSVL